MKNLLTTFILLSGFVSVSLAQKEGIRDEAFNALDKCIEAYQNAEKFSMNIEYSVYYNSTDYSKPNESKSGKLVKAKSNFYQEDFGNIRLLNQDYEVSVNDRAKVISITKRKQMEPLPTTFHMDSLKVQVSDVKKIKGGYSFYMKTGELEKFDVLLTPDGFLSILRSHFRNKIDFGQGKVKVVSQLKYSNFSLNPGLNAETFSEKKFVSVIKGDQVIPVGKYQDYTVINQLPKK